MRGKKRTATFLVVQMANSASYALDPEQGTVEDLAKQLKLGHVGRTLQAFAHGMTRVHTESQVTVFTDQITSFFESEYDVVA